jgi:hypothetical protein
LLKVQGSGEFNAIIGAVSRGNRFANSIRGFDEDQGKRFQSRLIVGKCLSSSLRNNQTLINPL